MNKITSAEITEIIGDINNELWRMERLEMEIKQVQQEIIIHPGLTNILFESLALKLHNFYTGCERIFQIIADELNGGKPSSYDWHRRLLERMTNQQINRPAVIQENTAKKLKEYLGFRHIVRNIYGFELDIKRVENLVNDYFFVWSDFKNDLATFLAWLEQLKFSIDD